MKEITIYRAFDGLEFKEREACIRHEQATLWDELCRLVLYGPEPCQSDFTDYLCRNRNSLIHYLESLK